MACAVSFNIEGYTFLPGQPLGKIIYKRADMKVRQADHGRRLHNMSESQ
jgi:hypothetical protein